MGAKQFDFFITYSELSYANNLKVLEIKNIISDISELKINIEQFKEIEKRKESVGRKIKRYKKRLSHYQVILACSNKEYNDEIMRLSKKNFIARWLRGGLPKVVLELAEIDIEKEKKAKKRIPELQEKLISLKAQYKKLSKNLKDFDKEKIKKLIDEKEARVQLKFKITKTFATLHPLIVDKNSQRWRLWSAERQLPKSGLAIHKKKTI